MYCIDAYVERGNILNPFYFKKKWHPDIEVPPKNPKATIESDSQINNHPSFWKH